jgi:hypothetical protein
MNTYWFVSSHVNSEKKRLRTKRRRNNEIITQKCGGRIEVTFIQ